MKSFSKLLHMPTPEGNKDIRVHYEMTQSMFEGKEMLGVNLCCLTLQFSQFKFSYTSGQAHYLGVRHCLTSEIISAFSKAEILNAYSHTTWFRLSCVLMNISQQ